MGPVAVVYCDGMSQGPSGGTQHPLLWLGAGVVLFGAGYLVYNRVQEGRRRIAFLNEYAPNIIDAVLPGQGKRIAEIGQARKR